MTDTPHADRGSIITYLDDTDPDNDESRRGEFHRADFRTADFRRAVLTGAVVTDPETGIGWVSIVRPDSEVTLIDPGMIVADPDRAVIDILAVALGTLAAELAEVDERAPVAFWDSQELLTCFAEAITPIESSLRVLAEADPQGALATVLTWIGCAAAEFERGHVGVGRCGILMANSAMADVVAPPADAP